MVARGPGAFQEMPLLHSFVSKKWRFANKPKAKQLN